MKQWICSPTFFTFPPPLSTTMYETMYETMSVHSNVHEIHNQGGVNIISYYSTFPFISVSTIFFFVLQYIYKARIRQKILQCIVQ